MASTTFEVQFTKTSIVELAYPVGSIYMSINSTNPGTLFGGTWEQISDKFLVASGSTFTALNTGGAASRTYTPDGSIENFTLETTHLPSHTHGLNSHTHGAGNMSLASGGGHTHKTQGYWSHENGSWVFQHRRAIYSSDPKETYVKAGGAHPHTFSGTSGANSDDTSSTGEGGAHNHSFTGTQTSITTLPPYLAVYMWKRTA